MGWKYWSCANQLSSFYNLTAHPIESHMLTILGDPLFRLLLLSGNFSLSYNIFVSPRPKNLSNRLCKFSHSYLKKLNLKKKHLLVFRWSLFKHQLIFSTQSHLQHATLHLLHHLCGVWFPVMLYYAIRLRYYNLILM